ncbi:MAG: DNA-formamidopyrimidine glycosylase family protein [Leeuwenhoekiella sp.]
MLESTDRLGKYLCFHLKKGGILVMHFGMSGKLQYYQHDEMPKHAHLTLIFDDHSRLSFVCPRKFGKLYLSDSLEKFQKDHQLGPDALAVK